jgi:hypothetical protein
MQIRLDMKNAGRMTDEIIPKGIVLYKPKEQSFNNK